MAESSDGAARPATTGGRDGDEGQSTGYHRNHGPRNKNKNKISQIHGGKFKGDCEDLEAKGAVYVIGSPDYNQTTRVIAEYIAKTYRGAKDFRIGLTERAFPDIEPPDPPQDANNIFQVEDWKLERKRWFDKTKER